ncbi:hypothetical protein ACN4EE_20280 [Geminocystis sp. CENA526]|uniref:hypothetical protein n=1 Tax=Geminocystis sp. CENA526 TaxID=1355871 RepID=UPI003D6E6D38
MDNTPENINPNGSIEIKKSLKRTILQLQKSIDIINDKKIKDLPNLTIVDDLVQSSNALVDYLRLKNLNNPDDSNNEEIDNLEDNNTISLDNTELNNPPLQKKIKKSKNNLNLLLVIVLLVSIFFNIFLGFINPKNAVKTLAENKDNLVEEIKNIEDIKNNDSINTENQTINNEIENIRIIENEENLEQNNESKSLENEENIENNQVIEDNNINTLDNENIEIDNKDNTVSESDKELELIFTPEDYLLKNIKEQIDQITTKYGKKLIIKIQANLNLNSLIIYISDDWYKLGDTQQNNLVNDILEKVKSLDFYKLNLLDINGNLLARNAVVGNDFIITKRSL